MAIITMLVPFAAEADDDPGLKGLVTCSTNTHPEDPCQQSQPSTTMFEGTHAKPGLSVTTSGDELYVCYAEKMPRFTFGAAPYLCCDIQTYLEPSSPGIWISHIHVPSLQKATLQLFIVNLTGKAEKPQTFLGIGAEHPVASGAPSSLGQTLTIKSADGAIIRTVWVFRGAACISATRCAFYYFADGSQFKDFLATLHSDVRSRLDHAVLVGIEGPPNDDPFGGKRIEELLKSYNKPAFRAFEAFVVGQVIPMVEAQSASPSARWVGGWSNGGSWALYMALAHPQLFSGALAFSIGDWIAPGSAGGPSRFEVGSGTLEGPFYRGVRSDAATLERLGQTVEQHYVVGGHSPSTWAALLDWSLRRTLPY